MIQKFWFCHLAHLILWWWWWWLWWWWRRWWWRKSCLSLLILIYGLQLPQQGQTFFSSSHILCEKTVLLFFGTYWVCFYTSYSMNNMISRYKTEISNFLNRAKLSFLHLLHYVENICPHIWWVFKLFTVWKGFKRYYIKIWFNFV